MASTNFERDGHLRNSRSAGRDSIWPPFDTVFRRKTAVVQTFPSVFIIDNWAQGACYNLGLHELASEGFHVSCARVACRQQLAR